MESWFVYNSVIAVAIVVFFVTYIKFVDGEIILLNSTSPIAFQLSTAAMLKPDEPQHWSLVVDKSSSSDSNRDPVSGISSNRNTETRTIRTNHMRSIYFKAPTIGCHGGQRIGTDGKCRPNSVQTGPSNFCPEGQLMGPDQKCRRQFTQTEED